MRKRVLVGLAVLALPTIAWATDQNINLTASVPKFCKFDSVQPISGDVNIGTTSLGIASSTVNILNAASATGLMQDFAFTFNATATCNAPSQLVISSINGGMKDATPTPVSSGVFLNRIDYLASAKWAGSAAAAITTSGTPVTSSPPRLVSSAKTGSVVVDVTANLNTSAPLAAGDYTDTLRISLTPQ